MVPECRRVSPRIMVQREADARIAAIQEKHQERIAEMEKNKEKHRAHAQWMREAPMREAEERRRRFEEARQKKMQEERQWLEEQARLRKEEDEKRETLRKILSEFLDTRPSLLLGVTDVVDEAWNAAQARSERRRFPHRDELFEEVLAAVDTELLTYRDVQDALHGAMDDARDRYYDSRTRTVETLE